MKKSKPKDHPCPDRIRGCDGPRGRKGRTCGNCYVEKNWGTRPDSV